MTKLLIRVDGEVSDEFATAFPSLTSHHHRVQTTLTGNVADQQELQGVLNLLSTLGLDILEVLTIPED